MSDDAPETDLFGKIDALRSKHGVTPKSAPPPPKAPDFPLLTEVVAQSSAPIPAEPPPTLTEVATKVAPKPSPTPKPPLPSGQAEDPLQALFAAHLAEVEATVRRVVREELSRAGITPPV